MRTIDDEREDRILRDGEVLRVSAMLMDEDQKAIAQDRQHLFGTRRHRPGFASVSTIDRAKMYSDADKRLSDRWRNPPALTDTATSLLAQPKKDGVSIYDRYDAAISNRWKGAQQ